MNTRPTAAALVPALVLASSLIVMARAKPVNIPVMATIADSAGGVWLRVASDTQGAYVTTSQVTSVIQSQLGGSDWLLTTYYTRRGSFAPSNRGVGFDLSEMKTGGTLSAPIVEPTVMPAHLKVSCSTVNVDMLRLTAGQTVICPGSYRFWAPNLRWYRLAFNSANYPEVDGVKVTCGSVAQSGGCNTWAITPSGAPTLADAVPKNLARLVEIDKEGFVLNDDGGTYYVSFNIMLAR